MRGGAAAGRIDLLTVLAHELEHLIGFGHNSEPGHLMSETLAPGKRLLPIGRVTRSTTSPPTQIGRVWQRFWQRGRLAPARRSNNGNRSRIEGRSLLLCLAGAKQLRSCDRRQDLLAHQIGRDVEFVLTRLVLMAMVPHLFAG